MLGGSGSHQLHVRLTDCTNPSYVHLGNTVNSSSTQPTSLLFARYSKHILCFAWHSGSALSIAYQDVMSMLCCCVSLRESRGWCEVGGMTS